ncbi:MAG: hypothetical protein H0W40_03030 [Methylibium sp.]|uniref:outer membrane lipoprotein n=1 Tax=Methylibium sp. TaxID=2067992 RepID=UPI0017D70A8F|nr:hypothetical protein [Methylibium sp.]MBA3596336.1 hypothetical protein [Methylibium sp.]
MNHLFATAASGCLVALSLGLAACAAPSSADRTPQSVRNGTVADVRSIEVEGEYQLGLGAEVGTSAGSVVGIQSGSGTRRDLVMVLAALGGGPAPDERERYRQAREGQRIVVRLDNGVGIAVTQEAEPELQVGELVRIEGRGTQARALRR